METSASFEARSAPSSYPTPDAQKVPQDPAAATEFEPKANSIVHCPLSF